MNKRRDEELLADHLNGEAGAFDELVNRYADELFGFVYRIVHNTAAADDLVQEAFLQMHLAANSFDPRRKLRPWLYTIAANKARDYLRGRGRRSEQSLESRSGDDDMPGLGSLLEAEGDSAATATAADQTRDDVRRVIAEMPEHLRLILVLGYYHQLPYAEIAEILDIPVGTVKSRLHSAVNHFARLWKSRSDGEPPE
mgnify:CR=1 FL=1